MTAKESSFEKRDHHLPGWMALLSVAELSVWRHGNFDDEARRVGVDSWIVPLPITADGSCDHLMLPGEGTLPAAPLLRLQEPLTPKAEFDLANQLRHWWSHPLALKLFGSPLLVLQGASNLSHKCFALRRLRLMADGLLVLCRDPVSIHSLKQQGFDGQIQCLGLPSIDQPQNYLQYLRSANHCMEPEGLWIPAVQAVSPALESCWTQGSSIKYQEWILQATAWSRLRYLEHGVAPVLIENWEGHQRWCSEETLKIFPQLLSSERPMSDLRAPQKLFWGKCQAQHVAILVHGFYLDKLSAILSRVHAAGKWQEPPGFDLYVSTPLEQLADAEALLREGGWPCVRLVGVANRGRDIAPFLMELLPAALQEGHTAFVKLHTKASPHLQRGDDWGKHLMDALLNSYFLETLAQKLRQDPSLGLLAPPGTLLPMSVALQSNVRHLQQLLQDKGWSGQWALQQYFIAGSAMAGRLQALQPLLDLHLRLESFEPEESQTDGTLAHALERWISLVVTAQNLQIEELEGRSDAVPKFGYGWV